MAKKKQKEERYIPSDQDMIHAKYCWSKDVAFSISKSLLNEGNLFCVERYKISKFSIREYIKKDQSKPVSSLNRKEFSLFDAEKTCFDLYEKTFKRLKKIDMEKTIEKKEEAEISSPKKDKNQKVTQIDLLDSIKEIEDEMINQ